MEDQDRVGPRICEEAERNQGKKAEHTRSRYSAGEGAAMDETRSLLRRLIGETRSTLQALEDSNSTDRVIINDCIEFKIRLGMLNDILGTLGVEEMVKPIEIEFAPGHLHQAVVVLKALESNLPAEMCKYTETVKALRMVHGELCRHGRVTLNSTGRNDNPKPRPPYKRKLSIPNDQSDD